MLTINAKKQLPIMFLISSFIAFGLTGCPDAEDTSLGGDDNTTELTLTPYCAKACDVIALCTDGDFDEDGCIFACSENGDTCADSAACIGTYDGWNDNCDYDLQCQFDANADCFDPTEDDDPALDICGQACLDPCVDHSAATCLEQCNGVFAENADSDCAELWTCISENKCTDNDPWPDYEEICGDVYQHGCIY